MSEEQVLPPTQEERDSFGSKAIEQAKRLYPESWSQSADGEYLGNIERFSGAVADYALRQLSITLASLAQSEAERERLQGELSAAEAGWTKQSALHGVTKFELAGERELHRWRDCKQELPQAEGDVLTSSDGQMRILYFDGHSNFDGGGWSMPAEDAGITHWKPLDWPALLEDKSKPVATTS